MTLDLQSWVGRSEDAEDVATPAPVAGLAATLDHAIPPWRAGEVPPLGHWLYFLPRALQSDLAEDGHPRRGGFLPPVALPRRMWAGGRFDFHAPIKVGAALRKRSTIQSVTPKTGASGEMVFVTVRHEVFADGQAAVTEEHDIVYRGQGAPMAPRDPTRTPAPAGVARTVTPDPVLLFRYSALTFNGHRIHYDRDYCIHEEGYPGLVVHGPLIATLLVDPWLRQSPGCVVTRFAFQARRPLFEGAPMHLMIDPREGGAGLRALDAHGEVAVEAQIDVR
jgi:3-methylfumaryl-CoA hydratase